MTTSEFAKLFAKTYNVRMQDADTWVHAIFEFLCEQCTVQREIKMQGLGVFRQVYSPPRKYTDLHTGALMVSEPHMNIQFDASPKLDKLMKKVKVPEEAKNDRRRKSDLPIRDPKPSDEPSALPVDEQQES